MRAINASAKLSIKANSSTAASEAIPETDGPARIPTIKYPVRRGSPAEAAGFQEQAIAALEGMWLPLVPFPQALNASIRIEEGVIGVECVEIRVDQHVTTHTACSGDRREFIQPRSEVLPGGFVFEVVVV